MAKGIKGVSQINDEIMKALNEFTSEITEGLEEAKIEVAKGTVKELKLTSPKNQGRYAKGWRTKKVGTAQVIHNATDYQLTHLLEKSHALRDGGRSNKFEHIGPAEEKAIEEYEKRVEKVIKG